MSARPLKFQAGVGATILTVPAPDRAARHNGDNGMERKTIVFATDAFALLVLLWPEPRG
jgi:hypothetical protein